MENLNNGSKPAKKLEKKAKGKNSTRRNIKKGAKAKSRKIKTRNLPAMRLFRLLKEQENKRMSKRAAAITAAAVAPAAVAAAANEANENNENNGNIGNLAKQLGSVALNKPKPAGKMNNNAANGWGGENL